MNSLSDEQLVAALYAAYAKVHPQLPAPTLFRTSHGIQSEYGIVTHGNSTLDNRSFLSRSLAPSAPSSQSPPPKLVIIDARSKLAAKANYAKGRTDFMVLKVSINVCD